MIETNKKIAIVILAAGGSGRFGKPKQLLRFEGKTLIRRVVEAALNSKADSILAVLGSNFDLLQKELEDLNCVFETNNNWKEGLSASIKSGLEKTLENEPEISAVIFALCDQPFIKSEHFDQLIEKFLETRKPIVASFYKEITGVPALFSKEFFPALMNLEGDGGAREIINKNPDFVEKIFLPEAAFDIDTKENFEDLKNFLPGNQKR